MSDRDRPDDGAGTTDENERPDSPDDTVPTDAAASTGDDPGAAATDDTETTAADGVDADRRQARIRRLEGETRRLRERYADIRERRYQRTALALGLVGVVFGLAALVVTSARDVLFALAGVGLFGAVLTWYLTPEQFIPLDVGEGIYATMADNEAAVAEQLGLSSTRVYVATDRGPRLFVPETDAYDAELLAATAEDDPLARPLVVGDRAARSGLSLRPVAAVLLDSFDDQHSGPLPAVPREAVSTLAEGVTDGLELAGAVDSDLDAADGRVTFSVHDPLYGDLTRFDHPIPSFLGSGLARALGTPVTVDVVVTATEGDETPLVTCRWTPDDAAAETDERAEAVDTTDETMANGR